MVMEHIDQLILKVLDERHVAAKRDYRPVETSKKPSLTGGLLRVGGRLTKRKRKVACNGICIVVRCHDRVHEMPRQEPPQIVSTVARNLRAARHENNMTQSDVARRVGVDAMYISRWERGRVTPSVINLESLATALGVTVGWLYTDHDRSAA